MQVLHPGVIWSPWQSWKRKRNKVGSKNEKTLNIIGDLWEKNDVYVIDYACAGWLYESWKSEDGKDRLSDWKFSRVCSQASANKSTLRLPIYCAGQVRGGEGMSNSRP